MDTPHPPPFEIRHPSSRFYGSVNPVNNFGWRRPLFSCSLFGPGDSLLVLMHVSSLIVTPIPSYWLFRCEGSMSLCHWRILTLDLFCCLLGDGGVRGDGPICRDSVFVVRSLSGETPCLVSLLNSDSYLVSNSYLKERVWLRIGYVFHRDLFIFRVQCESH